MGIYGGPGGIIHIHQAADRENKKCPTILAEHFNESKEPFQQRNNRER